MNYKELDLSLAYKLIGNGPVVCVCTKSDEDVYNIAPVAWNMPIQKNPFMFVLEVGQKHRTFKNIEQYKSFAIHVPNMFQIDMVKKAGSVSGDEINKFKELDIESIKTPKLDLRVPDNGFGYAEAELVEIKQIKDIKIIVGKAVSAFINDKAFNGERSIVENDDGKTLHHLGNKVFEVSGSRVY